MKRMMLMVISGGVALVAVVLVIRWPSQPDSSTQDRSAFARQMWAAADQPNPNEHELQALEASLKQNPDHSPILMRMAQLSRNMGRREDTIRYLREAVSADPRNAEIRLELGRALFEFGDTDGAIRETQALLDFDPLNVDALYNMGAIYGNLGQVDRAREYWTKAVAVNPDSPDAARAANALKQLDK